MLTAKSALKIADKLGAKVSRGRRHDRAVVRICEIFVGSYGIRRGTRVGHDYIPGQIHASMRQALGLARCPVSKKDYEETLKSKGILPTDNKSRPGDSRTGRRDKR